MIPDLGKYAFEVISAYAISLGLLVVLVSVTLRSGRAARATLREIEREVDKDG